MTISDLSDQSSFAVLERLINESPSVSGPHDNIHVLEKIEDSGELRDQPAGILCPGCAHTVDQYPDGLPAYLSWFRAECGTCQTELYRWSVVATTIDGHDDITTTALKHLVTSYWDRHLWNGIKTAEGCPRTREYLQLYSEQAEVFDWDWQPSCPLCRRSIDDLDFQTLDYHHWQRSPDIGICLCRECHDLINGGDRDADVDWQARRMGLRNKHDLQILRLAVREQSVAPVSTAEGLATRLVDRYNLVQDPATVRCMIRQAWDNDQLCASLSRALLVDSD